MRATFSVSFASWTPSQMQIKVKTLNHFSAACSESRHFAPLAASSRSFHGDGETRVSAATRAKRLQLCPTTLPGGKNTPRNTRISSDSELIVSFFFFLTAAHSVPSFGLHCVRMLRRKTEVKAQGFTLKAAMRNSVVSDSIRHRPGLDYMDFGTDSMGSGCFRGDLEASCADKNMHSMSVGSIPTWPSANQTTMWTTQVYVMPVCMFIQHEMQTFNSSFSPSLRQVYLCGSIRRIDASKCSGGMKT